MDAVREQSSGIRQMDNERISVVFDIKLKAALRKYRGASARPHVLGKTNCGLPGPEQAAELPLHVARDPEAASVAADEAYRNSLAEDLGAGAHKRRCGRMLAWWKRVGRERPGRQFASGFRSEEFFAVGHRAVGHV